MARNHRYLPLFPSKEELPYLPSEPFYDIHVSRTQNKKFYREFLIRAVKLFNGQFWSYGSKPKPFFDRLTQEELLNSCRVRVPVLWCIAVAKPKVDDSQFVSDMWLQYPQKQVGYHLFVYREHLHSIYSHININGLYRVTGLTTVSCIYPVLKNDNTPQQASRLIIGLLFHPNLNRGLRYFESMTEDRVDSGGVFSFTERFFIHPQSWQDLRSGFTNTRMVAIYVCAGARLLVEDGRTAASGWPGYEPNDRTLNYFQDGSLFIYEGEMRFVVPVITGAQTTGHVIENPFNDGINLFPVNTRKRIRSEYNDQNLKYVIFLGRHHSGTQSSCWKVDVLTNHSELYVPDGGHILAIETWEQGLEEIYWRHRYERLFDSVVSTLENVPPVSQIPFERPTEEMIKRILGSDEYYGGRELQRDFVVNLDEYPTLTKWRFQEHFGGGFVERTLVRNWGNQRINTPPMFIPHLLGEDLINFTPFNFKPLTCVPHPNGAHFGCAYKCELDYFVHEQKEVPEYLWVDPVEWYAFTRGRIQFDPRRHRIGVDSRVYTKSLLIVGKAVTGYMRPISADQPMEVD